MSDFDKFIADKLEEEGDFPNRDRNWRHLSQRLQAFEVGGNVRPSLWHYWPAAAAVVISLSVAGWLVWKMKAVQQENTALRQEIAALKQAMPTVTPMATLPEQNTTKSAVAEQNAAQPGDNITPSDAPVRQYPPKNQPRSSASTIATTTPRAPGHKQKNKDFDQWANQPDNAAATTPGALLIPSKSIDSTKNKHSNTLSAVAAGNMLETTSPTQFPALIVPSDSSQLITSTPPLDSAQTALAVKEPVSPATLPAVSTDSVATAAVPPPIIQPLRRHYRFRLGVGAVAGWSLPREQGVSPILGSGLVAAYAPVRFLQLTASADWLHFNINTSQYLPRFHAPHHGPPSHLHPHDELVQVESEQRQQHFALGLTYALSVHGWIRPVVRVAHTWVHIAPGLVSFKFEEPHGGGGPGPGPGHNDPEYVAQKFDGQTISNIWRFGAGLEHELPRWTLGLWADYSKNLGASESTFDALLLRGGVQYKF